MIILEGPDGGGKTELAARVATHTGFPIAPRVVSADMEAMVDLAKWTEDNLAKGFQRTIFDRHRLISEPIYGPATKSRQDPNFYDLGWMAEMMWQFYALKPIIVYCLPDLGTVRANVMDPRSRNQAVAGRITAVYASYVNRATLDFTRGVGKLYNYKTTRIEEILQWIDFKLEEQHDHAARPSVRVPGARREGVPSPAAG